MYWVPCRIHSTRLQVCHRVCMGLCRNALAQKLRSGFEPGKRLGNRIVELYKMRPSSTAYVVSQATPFSRRERVWSARIHRVVTTPRSWCDQSDQVFRHDVIISREIHVPRAPVRSSAVQTRKVIMAASICKNNNKARDVVRLSPLSVIYERVWPARL